MTSLGVKRMWLMSFIDYFGLVTDPRKDINVKHELLDVIFFLPIGLSHNLI